MKLRVNPHWKKAKKIIPGGTQLLSKRSERFLPDYWPAYFKKAKGVNITDLDGNTYVDMSIMGIGSCILGYADPDVNRAVIDVVRNGSMGTLNSPEEIELAELLVKLHPWADMARYARTGGEACAMAVRIGRAFSKKDKIAFCGYHGWHDWYLAGNLADSHNLDGHLLPGLDPLGVPRGLLHSAIPFRFNHIEDLEKIFAEHDVGVIIMEALRHQEPKNNFLQKVRTIADRKKAVLIFDEVSSGFRMNVGGVHLLYGVNPDVAVFGKAMGNGFPISAVIGRREIMDCAQTSFISSTNWTERIGPTAALATIKKLKNKRVPPHIDRIGRMIGAGWLTLAKKHGLKIDVEGPNALITIKFLYPNVQEILTLFTQEMLRRGFLVSPTVYVCYAHKNFHIKKYLNAVDDVFAIIRRAVDQQNVKKLLLGPTAYSDFKRLT